MVLTYFHEDHTGSAAEIAGWAGETVVCGAADAPAALHAATDPVA